jgi:hypothetical protein
MPTTSRIGHTLGGAHADGKHRRSGARGGGLRALSRVSSIRQHDDSGDAPAAEALARGGDCSSQIGPPPVGDQAFDRRLGQRFADPEHLRLADLFERRKDLRFDEGLRQGDARFPIGICDAHAARCIDEHRNDDVTGVGGRQQDDRTAREQEDGDEREYAQGREHPALHGRQRYEGATV